MSGYCVVTFPSTHAAMQAEKHLKGALPVQMIPTPRCISASCGIALRFDPSSLPEAQKALAAFPEPFALYQLAGESPTLLLCKK